ncbi:MAG: hypothetical protein AAFY78_24755 [Cyanobacteria bacterium J06648_16]
MNDGWMITHDPSHLRKGRKGMYVALRQEAITEESINVKSPRRSATGA